jgi:hypothetical protein
MLGLVTLHWQHTVHEQCNWRPVMVAQPSGPGLWWSGQVTHANVTTPPSPCAQTWRLLAHLKCGPPSMGFVSLLLPFISAHFVFSGRSNIVVWQPPDRSIDRSIGFLYSSSHVLPGVTTILARSEQGGPHCAPLVGGHQGLLSHRHVECVDML